MAKNSSFLALPCELRQIIYQHYVYQPDGYHYDYEAGKLRLLNGFQIDLSLMYTCKQVADELRSMALETNVVTFQTVLLGKRRLTPGYVHLAMCQVDDARQRLMRRIACADEAGFGRPGWLREGYPEVYAELVTRYPTVAPLLETGDLYKFTGHSGHPPSLTKECACFLLDKLSKTANFDERIREAKEHFITPDVLHSPWLISPPDPWLFPSDEDAERLAKLIPAKWFPNSNPLPKIHYWQRHKWRLSAAASAIRFLDSVSPNTRLQIRKMVLHEDRDSISESPCHVLGLVRFCLENRKLRIERRLDLWHTILRRYCGRDQRSAVWQPIMFRTLASTSLPDMCEHFEEWFEEVPALFHAGMPQNSFSLVIDGGSFPTEASRIIEILKTLVAWQRASTKWSAHFSANTAMTDLMRKNLPNELRRMSGVFTVKVQEIITNLVHGRGNILCNFPIDSNFPDESALISRIVPTDEEGWLYGLAYEDCLHLMPVSAWRSFSISDVLFEYEPAPVDSIPAEDLLRYALRDSTLEERIEREDNRPWQS